MNLNPLDPLTPFERAIHTNRITQKIFPPLKSVPSNSVRIAAAFEGEKICYKILTLGRPDERTSDPVDGIISIN